MLLSRRLKTVGDFVGPGEIVADVGADHGILELYLIGKYDNVYVTAIENKKGPYKNLSDGLRALRNIRLSFSSGLTAVNRETETVVIAGMGGYNIKKILDEYPKKVKKVKKFIIDAHRDIPVVRKTLIDYGFNISKEKIVYEQGKFYVINCFRKTIEKINYSEDEIDFGYKIYEDELWPKYKAHLIQKNEKAILKICNEEKMKDKVLKLRNLNERLKKYGEN